MPGNVQNKNVLNCPTLGTFQFAIKFRIDKVTVYRLKIGNYSRSGLLYSNKKPQGNLITENERSKRTEEHIEKITYAV